MRIYRCLPFNLIKEATHTRLNIMFHSSIRNIPQNVIEGKNTGVMTSHKLRNRNNKKTRKADTYKVGEKIFIKDFNHSSKTDPLFTGPYEVKHVDNNPTEWR